MPFDDSLKFPETDANVNDSGLMRHENRWGFGTSYMAAFKILLKPVSFMVLIFTGEEKITRTLCLSRARDACTECSRMARGCQDLKIRNDFSDFKSRAAVKGIPNWPGAP
tara:strand:+ start:4606 stop:4935 length:330 start_codon:yes stop_codon:yes gene_type:complete